MSFLGFSTFHVVMIILLILSIDKILSSFSSTISSGINLLLNNLRFVIAIIPFAPTEPAVEEQEEGLSRKELGIYCFIAACVLFVAPMLKKRGF